MLQCTTSPGCSTQAWAAACLLRLPLLFHTILSSAQATSGRTSASSRLRLLSQKFWRSESRCQRLLCREQWAGPWCFLCRCPRSSTSCRDCKLRWRSVLVGSSRTTSAMQRKPVSCLWVRFWGRPGHLWLLRCAGSHLK